jgi:hypothetical protein
MTVRARPASGLPAQDVEVLADRAGISLGDDEESASARKEGAGALLGYATGLGGGIVLAAVEPLARRLPATLAAVVVGLGVMAATDASSAALGTTDPKQWSPADWASDVLPHLAYGAAAVAALRATCP